MKKYIVLYTKQLVRLIVKLLLLVKTGIYIDVLINLLNPFSPGTSLIIWSSSAPSKSFSCRLCLIGSSAGILWISIEIAITVLWHYCPVLIFRKWFPLSNLILFPGILKEEWLFGHQIWDYISLWICLEHSDKRDFLIFP